MTPNNYDAKTVLDAGMMISAVRRPDGGAAPFVVIPKDAQVESLENLLDAPLRVKQEVALHDPESFVAYVKRFRAPGTTVFFDRDDQQFKAILDYHEGGCGDYAALADTAPHWCEHVATYKVRNTPEWNKWLGVNGRQMKQGDFAQFIEANAADIANDFGQTMLKVALSLQIKKDVTFVSDQRLDNGSVQLRFEEQVSGSAQLGQLTVPSSFALEIEPFVGGPKYRVECRFRYRLQDRAAILWFDMLQVDRMLNEALKKVRGLIEEGIGFKALAGE